MKNILLSGLYLLCVMLSPAVAWADTLEEAIAQVKAKQLSSIVIRQHDVALFEQYYNDTHPDDLHDVRSASKSLTNLLYGIAVEQQLFTSQNDKVLADFGEYRPQYFTSEKRKMTYFDLMSMTNPLECNDWNQYSAGNEERMYLRKDWVEFFLDLPVRGAPPWEKPFEQQPYGRGFSYCTAGVSITGAAIERRSGMRLDEFARKYLFSAMQISEVTWYKSPMGIIQAGGGLRIKPTDFIKFGQLLLNDGKWQGKQLLSRAWLAASVKAYSQVSEKPKTDYGMLWWLVNFEVNGRTIRTIAASGNGGNYLFAIPELNAAVVITATAYGTPYMHKQARQLMTDAILPALLK
ncbi:MAG: serine hydrolase domain-containing protein [Aestuariibacter sp.]